jgi:hypothetical protein
MKEKLWLVYAIVGMLLGHYAYDVVYDLKFLHAIRVANDIRIAIGH